MTPLSQDAIREIAEKRLKWLELLAETVKTAPHDPGGHDEICQIVDDMEADLSRLKLNLARQEAEQRQTDWKDHQKMLHTILNWASHNRRFDPTFVHRLLKVGKPLNDGQLAALDNIITKFNIDLDKWEPE